jgi:hypothetical protein
MIQKMDKKALALRIFGKDTDDPLESTKDGDTAEHYNESVEA